MDNSEEEKYSLPVGKADLERMTMLGNLYMPYCTEFLLENGLRSGIKVADIGCGPGNTSLWLTDQVGEAGKVIAIDNSAEQLSILNNRILEKKIHNISTLHADIYQIDQMKEKFDLIFCRFLFIHLTNPLLAIKKLCMLLKPGGSLVIAELDNSTWSSYPENKALKKDTELLCNVGVQKGVDFCIGPKLYRYLREVNFNLLNVKIAQPILEGNNRNYLMLKSKAWANVYLEYNLVSSVDIQYLQKGLCEMINNPDYLLIGAKMFLVCAKNT
ncbi:MAG TPA: methyltransferase domain-containing protein [Gammaproteobacteria bacterium]|jgi:ubiquinone/menaquinone biosynthesis C-methylase UbiE|nr:methyltransferase domain-containing protein [Gammaproteobacteria bacterium]